MRRYRSVSITLGALFGAAIIASCGDSTTGPDITTTVFATSLNIHLASMTKTGDGLYYQDSVIGTGNAAAVGNGALVLYRGWLADGTPFDSNTTTGLAFSIGAEQVIAGWDEGLVGMKVGGWRKLVIPPSLGYGSGGNPPKIPGNAILVFNVGLKALQ